VLLRRYGKGIRGWLVERGGAWRRGAARGEAPRALEDGFDGHADGDIIYR